MNILFALDKYSFKMGGASLSARTVAQYLSQRGYNVTILETANGRDSIENGIRILRRSLPHRGHDNTLKTIKHNQDWQRLLEREVPHIKPDYILTQGYLKIGTVQFCKKHHIPIMTFMTGLEEFHPAFFFNKDPDTHQFNFWNAKLSHKLKYHWMKKVLHLYQQSLRDSTVVIANSHFIKNMCKDIAHVNADILYPPIDFNTEINPSQKRKVLNNNGPVVFVKPQKIKGVEKFYQIAKFNQDIQFLVVGKARSYHEKMMKSLPNVTLHPETEDMISIYSRCSAILGPALIPEPFGRVFVEAGMFGLPAIAHKTGGIIESVGQGGELLPIGSSPQLWGERIRKVLSEKSYHHYRQAAHHNAQSILTQCDSGFDKLIEHLN